MAKDHRAVMTENLTFLADHTLLTNRVLDECVKREIFVPDQRSKIKKQGSLDDYDTKSYFYNHVLQYVDEESFANFVELGQESQTKQPSTVLEVLRKGLKNPVGTNLLPAFDFENKTYMDGSTVRHMSWTSPVTFPDTIPEFERYEVKSNARFALIVNITTFGDERNRNGAQYDSVALATVLTKFGFHVSEIVGQDGQITSKELKRRLELFKQTCQSGDVCIVAIMSHGERDVIITSEGNHLSINAHILAPFNNNNFKEFKGKPKIFFFQACRGNERDTGIDSTQADGNTFTKYNEGVTELKIPSWTDMLVCYATMEGQYSYRESNGSWFIQILCQKLDAYGRKLDLSKILYLVAAQMKDESGSGGEKQICPWTNIGFTKEFYF